MRTYGTIGHAKGVWGVKAEPHVLLRLKRVFGSVRPTDFGWIRLSDTLEVCRNLAWFCDRYPLAFEKPDDEAYLATRAGEHQDRESIVDKLLTGQQTSRTFKLALPPREYQCIAAELALRSKGLLIADDLGLGKTATAICALTEPGTRPALVVAPTHLQRQWREQIKLFAPHLEAHILKKGTPYDYTAGRKRKNSNQLTLVRPHPDVLICTYAKLAGWSETLSPVVKSVIFDECHELRSGVSTQKGAAAKHIADNVEYRIGLSATPIFNFGGEIWNVLNILQPGVLGQNHEFTQEWCSQGEKIRLEDPAAFGTYCREIGIMIRRTRKEVGRELPELIKSVQAVDCDANALAAVESSAYELAKIILRQNSHTLSKGESFRAGGEFDALMRQATGLAKAPYVADFVRMLLESGEKVVLYGWHRAVYDIWLKRLEEFKPVLYTGTESPTQKDEAKRKFVAGETPLIIISLRSGAGLDGLQYSGCRTVVFGELDWSPAVLEQDAGRIHRDGQEEPVVAYYPLADSGSDPVMADVLQLKRAQLEGLRDPTGPTGLERLDSGGAHVRRLAEEFLKRKRAHLAVVGPV